MQSAPRFLKLKWNQFILKKNDNHKKIALWAFFTEIKITMYLFAAKKIRIVIFAQTSLINNTSVTLSSKEGKSPKNSI